MIAEKLNTRAELIRIHGTAGKFMAAVHFTLLRLLRVDGLAVVPSMAF
ncbi:hypothetical protein KUD97_10695 [Desulfovibrio desulfuricans]|nr:hypothetical protein [Desulfovibrio desulfuricans]UIA99418.1 hypothetical protein KUD97_10695 [Desulfovibrio desulfuricans]